MLIISYLRFQYKYSQILNIEDSSHNRNIIIWENINQIVFCFIQGTSTWVSMGVISDGNKYGAPEGVIFSFPVIVDSSTRQWQIVDNVPLDDVAKQRLRVTGEELVAEREEALAATTNA